MPGTQGFNYTHITSATTTVIRTGKGRLHSIVINTSTAGTITVGDNTTTGGTIIAVITAIASVGPAVCLYDVDFNTGLTIVTSATVDITVCWVAL